MLSSIEYQRFTQTQLSEDQSNFDTTKLIHRVLEMSKLEKFTCTIQNLRLNTQNQLQLNSLYSNKHFKLNHEYIQFPLLKSQIISRTLSNHKLIMKQTNKLHKSHSQIEALQFPSKFTKIRRKSGCEILSDKQVRLATLYPNTYIAFHQLQKQNKRNEMRKKTIFKRMSSILIKHSNNIKSQTSNRLSQQIIQDEIPTKLDEQSSKIILKQFQQQIGCFKEIQDLFSNMEIHKNYNYYKKNQKNILSLQIILLLLTEISKNNQQKEILNVSKKKRKTFTSIQNYINGHSQINQAKSVGFIQKQIHFQYQNLQSLTETETSSPIKITQTVLNFTHIKSLSNLPDIKEAQTNRQNNNRLYQIAQKAKNVYIFSPLKTKQVLNKIEQ